MTRYPENTTTSLDDFRKCGWLEAINESKKDGYLLMSNSLSVAAKKAADEQRFSESKMLWLLSDACSMMLKPSSLNQPFAACTVTSYGRSAIVEDFQIENTIELFSEISDEITDFKLRARIADIVWLLKKPRDKDFAIKSIDAYMETPLIEENIRGDGSESWERAARLCLQLNKGAGDRIDKIKKQLVESIQTASKTDTNLVWCLSQILMECFRLEKDQLLSLAEKIENLAVELEILKNLSSAKSFFEISSNFYESGSNKIKSVEMTVKLAECFVKEAQTGHGMSARFRYEDAIQIYRKIPNIYRKAHNINARIEELIIALGLAGKEALTEMVSVPISHFMDSDKIDLNEDFLEKVQEESIRQVQSKDVVNALLNLANIYPGINLQVVFKSCKKESESFYDLITKTQLSSDGRVISQYTNSLWEKIIQYYKDELFFAIQGAIEPALSVVQLEHRLTEIDFYSIAKQSPVVPQGREKLIAKGLFAGYDNDFVTALHILIPQIEHLVRVHLKRAGVKTSTLDKNGIETENGLSTLMDNPEVNTIFGEDLAFEFKALLCDSFGANLRNNLAHGLLDYGESQSIYSVYAWWLMLRMVFNTFWNSKMASEQTESSK